MTDQEKLLDALRFIPADDRDTWIRVGSALKTGLDDQAAAFALWDGWSKTAGNYNARTIAGDWKAIKVGKVNLGSLFYLARRYGYGGTAPTALPVRPSRKRDLAAERRKEAEAAAAAQALAVELVRTAVFEPHPYLEAKGFPDPYKGLVATLKDKARKIDWSGWLIVPIWHYRRRDVLSAQLIHEDGRKRFLKGGRIRGGVYKVGRGPETWLCEGYATGLSVAAALDYLYRPATVVCCFSDAGIRNVPLRPAFVVADHDRYRCRACKVAWDDRTWPERPPCPRCGSPKQVVRPAGPRAALTRGVPWWMPPAGDANDFHVEHGLAALASQFRALTQEKADVTNTP